MSDYPSPNATTVAAVIVAHNAEDGFDEHVITLLEQLHHIYLIDNQSDSAHAEQLRLLSRKDPRITLLHCKENNLAKAQNMGIQAARADTYEWVLLLDDDSRVGNDMIAQMKHAYEARDDKTSIGLIAPNMIDTNSCRDTHYIVPHYMVGFRTHAMNGDAFSGALFVIASGSLIPMHTFDAIGMMDESYVIDYIDKEFCLRMREKGLEILVVPSATLNHSIGKCEDHELFGRRITTTNHSAARRYTIYRNRLRTMGRYCLSAPSFVTHDVLAMGYDLLRITAFETHKGEKLRAIGRGICDAVLGRSDQQPKQ